MKYGTIVMKQERIGQGDKLLYSRSMTASHMRKLRSRRAGLVIAKAELRLTIGKISSSARSLSSLGRLSIGRLLTCSEDDVGDFYTHSFRSASIGRICPVGEDDNIHFIGRIADYGGSSVAGVAERLLRSIRALYPGIV